MKACLDGKGCVTIGRELGYMRETMVTSLLFYTKAKIEARLPKDYPFEKEPFDYKFGSLVLAAQKPNRGEDSKLPQSGRL